MLTVIAILTVLLLIGLSVLLTYAYTITIPPVSPGFVPYCLEHPGRNYPTVGLSRMTVCDPEHPKIIDSRSTAVLVGCRIAAILTDLWFGAGQIPYRFPNGLFKTVTEVPNDDPSVLVVLVHGLRGHPSGFRSYIDAIGKARPGARIVIPHVRDRGLCTLDEASQPILELVEQHLEDHGARVPIWLVGTSNGGRIVANVESRLRGRESIIHTVTIGAPLGGSMAMRLVDRISTGLADRYFPNGLAAELRPESERVNQLLAMIRDDKNRSPYAERMYTCIVTLDEHNIWPPNYALPTLSDPVEYAYTDSVGHSAITAAARDYILARLSTPSAH